jgi:adenylate cyclase
MITFSANPSEDLLSLHGLTRRQAQIARLIATGRSNAEIARELSISLHTVRHHAEQVLSKLGLRTRSQVAATLHRTPLQSNRRTATTSDRAREFYLRGRYELHRRGLRLLEAARNFAEAVREDPAYAEAHAALALSNALAICHAGIPSQRLEPGIREAARTATRLDPTLSEPHVALSYIAPDRHEAERELRIAISLNPADAAARSRLGQLLAMAGREDEAIAESHLAVELDPVNAMHRAARGRILYWGRRFDESLEELVEAERMDPELWLASQWLFAVYGALGRAEDALAARERARPLGSWLSQADIEVVIRAAIGGEASLRGPALERLRQLRWRAGANLNFIAFFAALLGETGTALDLLEETYLAGTLAPEIGVDWRVDSLRGEPRFRSLLARMSLPNRGPAMV